MSRCAELRQRADSSGMTLIELVISIMLSGILMLAIVGALSVFLINSPAVSKSLDSSNEDQSLSIYWPRDVRDALSLSPTGSTCLTPAIPVTVDTVANDGSTVPVRYDIAGTTITRTVGGQTLAIARSVATACVDWPDGAADATLTVTSLDGTAASVTATRRVSP